MNSLAVTDRLYRAAGLSVVFTGIMAASLLLMQLAVEIEALGAVRPKIPW